MAALRLPLAWVPPLAWQMLGSAARRPVHRLLSALAALGALLWVDVLVSRGLRRLLLHGEHRLLSALATLGALLWFDVLVSKSGAPRVRDGQLRLITNRLFLSGVFLFKSNKKNISFLQVEIQEDPKLKQQQ